jgi:hypothetical protein
VTTPLIPERVWEAALRATNAPTYLPNLFPELDAEAKERWERKNREFRELVEAYHARWDDDFYMGEVARLHSPSGGEYYDSACEGCDFGGYEGDPPDWPCRTAEILINRMENEPL